MAALFHFLPHSQLDQLAECGKLKPVELAKYGLDRVLADCPEITVDVLAHPVQKGPGDEPGVLLYPRTPGGKDPRHTIYRPNDQTWHAVEAPEGHKRAEKKLPLRWIGWANESAPTPADLERKRLVAGAHIIDDVGLQWLVPIARSITAKYGRLPCDFRFDANGKPVLKLKPSYAGLWEASSVALEFFASQGQIENTMELVSIAIAALSTNYRLGMCEVNALGEGGLIGLDSEKIVAILRALVDWDAWEAALQKKTAESSSSPNDSNSTPGAAADSLPIAQREASLP